MFLLLFFVLLIQIFAYWIFEPLASFLEYVLEIRLFPIIDPKNEGKSLREKFMRLMQTKVF